MVFFSFDMKLLARFYESREAGPYLRIARTMALNPQSRKALLPDAVQHGDAGHDRTQ